MKTKITICLITIFLLCLCSVYADEAADVIIETKTAKPGEVVEIRVNILNNPGILATKFLLNYDKSRLELLSVKDGHLLDGGVFGNDYLTTPYILLWNSASHTNYTATGTLAILNFKVLDTAAGGNSFININYFDDDVYNVELNNVSLKIENGGIFVMVACHEQEKTYNNNSKSEFLADTTQNNIENSSEIENPIENEKSIIFTVGQNKVVAFGEEILYDTAPIIKNDRVMLQARYVAELLGATVVWNETSTGNGIVSISKDNNEIHIATNDDKAYVNGKLCILDSKAFIMNDRTYTPMRFIAESLGAKVEWNNDNKQVIISL